MWLENDIITIVVLIRFELILQHPKCCVLPITPQNNFIRVFGGIRTHDFWFTIRWVNQLLHKHHTIVGIAGLEPATTCSQSTHTNQLYYIPIIFFIYVIVFYLLQINIKKSHSILMRFFYILYIIQPHSSWYIMMLRLWLCHIIVIIIHLFFLRNAKQ